MKIAAITKFKHGALWELLKKLGWTQKELAIRMGYENGQQVVSKILNLSHRPSEKLMTRMQKAFAEAGETVEMEKLFPDSYIGFHRPLTVVQVEEVEPLQLAQFVQHQRALLQDAEPPLPSEIVKTEEVLSQFKSYLTDKEFDAIHRHFIKDESYRDIARKYGCSTELIRQRVEKGLRKIRDAIEAEDEQKGKCQKVKLFKCPDGIWRTKMVVNRPDW
jgi:DNA-directed RNA polymerase sigma subunit (sigma70/sigma32)